MVSLLFLCCHGNLETLSDSLRSLLSAWHRSLQTRKQAAQYGLRKLSPRASAHYKICSSFAMPALYRSCPWKHRFLWTDSIKINFCPWNRGFWWTGYKTTGILRWALMRSLWHSEHFDEKPGNSLWKCTIFQKKINVFDDTSTKNPAILCGSVPVFKKQQNSQTTAKWFASL